MPKGKHNNHAKADRQHRWQDLPQIASTGYVKLRVGKGHPLADPNGYAYAHLLIWVAAGRSRPRRGEVLHFKNDVKTDYRLENLELRSRAAHNRLHNATRKRDARGRLTKVNH